MSKSTHALLPGSYDPITRGHYDVIRRAAAMFDRVTVAVMTNDMKSYVATASSKEYLFSMEQRTAMAVLACRDLPNVSVIASHARLIDLFDEIGGVEEARAVLAVQNAGVPLLATAHGGELSMLMRREGVRMMHDAGIFAYYVGIARASGGFSFTVTPWEDANALL